MFSRFPTTSAIAFVTVSALLARAQTLISSQGPFTWTDAGCGEQMTIAVQVYSNVPGYPGLYQWTYTVNNISVASTYGDSAVNGIGYVEFKFGQALPDLGNFTVPANWSKQTWTDSNALTYLSVGSNSGDDPNSPGWPQAIYALPPGQSMTFSFTTSARQIASLPTCSYDSNGNITSSACAFAGAAEALEGFAVKGPGLGAASRPHAPRVKIARLLSGTTRPHDQGACTGDPVGPVAAPGAGVINLQSFLWAGGGAGGQGLIPLYQGDGDWQDDTLATEGTHVVNQPQWVADTNGDGGAQENDPVAFTSGTTFFLHNVTLTSSDPTITSAKLQIIADQGNAISFQQTNISFTNGSATVDVQAEGPLPAAIANMDANFTWNISTDGGQSWQTFAGTEHNMFVTLGPAEGFPGADGVTAWPDITAARVDQVTSLFAGETSAENVISAAKQYTINSFTTGSNGLDTAYGGNPWAALDAEVASGVQIDAQLDCYSLTEITVVQLLQVGIDVSLIPAFATTDGDALTQETRPDAQNSSVMDWLEFLGADGVTQNVLEAFLTLNLSGQPVEAHTVWPAAGPLSPWSTTVAGMPSNAAAPLAFTVMYTTLATIQGSATNANGGQQWWIAHGTGVTIQGPIAFPVSIP